MGIFANQFSNVVEWQEDEPGVLFYKWTNQEIKKGSRLIIRPGQDAIFLYNGVVEGVFEQEGNFDIESDIIPFLTTLKSFRFGFNTPLRAEVVFINTKELLVKWGTKNAINIPAPGLPGGMPIRAFGTFNCKIADRMIVIDKLAGIREKYTVDDVKTRIVASLDQLLMSWIGKEGRDMFNLQMDAKNIAEGLENDLNNDMMQIGIGITGLTIESFSYPEEVRKMQEKAAGQAMVGDVNRYTQMAAADGMSNGTGGNHIAGDMVSMQMGMAIGQQMMNQMNMQNAQNAQGAQGQQGAQAGAAQTGAAPADAAQAGGTGAGPKFCPNCGTPTNGSKFCPNCGTQLL